MGGRVLIATSRYYNIRTVMPLLVLLVPLLLLNLPRFC